MNIKRLSWPLRTALVLVLLVMLVPVYWLLRTAFSTDQQVYSSPPKLFPLPPTLKNFASAADLVGPSLNVSAWISVGTVLLTLVVAIPTAYGLTLLGDGKASGASRFLVLASLMFPSVMFVIPLYSLLYQAGMLNSIPGLVVADCIYSVPLGIVVTFTYFRTIPASLTEAAIVDGASHLSIFWRIACPLASPAIVTTAIFAFLFAWGDFLFAATFGAGRGLVPAPVVIAGLIQNQSNVTPWTEVMAASVLISLRRWWLSWLLKGLSRAD